MVTELFTAHPDEAQIWAVRVSPPVGRRFSYWLGYVASLVIRVFTLGHGGRYSHLLIRLGDTIWEAAGSGVREGKADEYRDSRFVTDVYAAALTAEQRERLLAWARRALGTPYDWTQLLRIALAELGQNPDLLPIPDFGPERLICSEFVALAYRQAGVDLTGDTALWHWTPDDVRRASSRGVVELRGRLAWERDPESA